MAGRPRIYESVEELEKMCDSYFMQEVMIDAANKVNVNEKLPSGKFEPIAKPTVTGLALHLGFADKTTLYEYRDRPEFSYPIKKSLTRIEQYHEAALDSNSVAGRIFALKNMGWRDKVETGFTDNEGKDVSPVHIIQLPDNNRDSNNSTKEPAAV